MRTMEKLLMVTITVLMCEMVLGVTVLLVYGIWQLFCD